MTIFDETVTDVAGVPRSLAEYRGRALFIVNVASGCGFAPQMKALEELQQTYGPRGLTVLAFPSDDFHQESGRGRDLVTNACARHPITFPILGLTHVRGAQIHPLFKQLTARGGGVLGSRILWNFEKFLVGRDGGVVDRWRSPTSPTSARVRRVIERALDQTNLGGA